MPSSSDAVATSAFSVPLLSRVSASSRRSFDRLPWCAVTASSPSRSLRCRATRSASRRVFTNTSVVRCSRIERGEPVVVLLPDLVRHHRFERRPRQLERQVDASRRWPSSTIAQSAVASALRRMPTRKRRPPRSASASPTGRCAAAAARPPAAAARATAPGARRAACRSPRESRRR